MDKNENGHYRGLHIVSISPLSGKVQWAEVFDTHKSSEKLERFIVNYLFRPQTAEEGEIIVVACKDECVTNLSDSVKEWFKSVGSTLIDEIQYRHSFVFIGIVGHKQVYEKSSESINEEI